MAHKLYKYQYFNSVSENKGQGPQVIYEWFPENQQPSQFVIANNIEDLHFSGHGVGRDYGFLRARVIDEVNAITGFEPLDPETYTVANWDLLDPGGENPILKDIACIYFAATKVLRLLHISNEKDIDNWSMLADKSHGSRGHRLTKSKKITSYALSKEDSDAFFKAVRAHYIGYLEADTDDLLEWITNKVGSPYENNGFAQKPYYSQGLKIELADIIEGGNY